jgi:hypothetical protein
LFVIPAVSLLIKHLSAQCQGLKRGEDGRVSAFIEKKVDATPPPPRLACTNKVGWPGGVIKLPDPPNFLLALKVKDIE